MLLNCEEKKLQELGTEYLKSETEGVSCWDGDKRSSDFIILFFFLFAKSPLLNSLLSFCYIYFLPSLYTDSVPPEISFGCLMKNIQIFVQKVYPFDMKRKFKPGLQTDVNCAALC